MPQSLCFNDFTFSPVTRDNQPWFKSSELACALGYKREDILGKLYRKNADEFTSDMTQVVENLDNTESVFPVKPRIFSLRGCHLLAMFARTPVAKAFRKWVLDVIEQYGDKVPVAEPVMLNDTSRPSRRTDPERKTLTSIRTRLSELNAEYIRLNQGAYAAMLGLIPSMQPGSKDRLIDALASQSYDAYNWIDEGLQRMRLAIIAARAANRTAPGNGGFLFYIFLEN